MHLAVDKSVAVCSSDLHGAGPTEGGRFGVSFKDIEPP